MTLCNLESIIHCRKMKDCSYFGIPLFNIIMSIIFFSIEYIFIVDSITTMVTIFIDALSHVILAKKN